MKNMLMHLHKLGIKDTELWDGTEIKNLRAVAGEYPAACNGYLQAVVNGRVMKYPFRLRCQGCGGCD